MLMVQRLKMQPSMKLVMLWIQTQIVSLSVYGNSLKQTTLLVLKQTLITTLHFQWTVQQSQVAFQLTQMFTCVSLRSLMVQKLTLVLFMLEKAISHFQATSPTTTLM